MLEFFEEISINGIVARHICEEFMKIPFEIREKVYRNTCKELEKKDYKVVKFLKKYHEKHILPFEKDC